MVEGAFIGLHPTPPPPRFTRPPTPSPPRGSDPRPPTPPHRYDPSHRPLRFPGLAPRGRDGPFHRKLPAAHLPLGAAALHNPAMLPQKIKLRVTIFVGVLLITTGLAALLLLLNWLSSARTVRTFTRDLLDPVARQVTDQTRDMLNSAASAAHVAAAVIGDVPAELRPNALDVVGSALLSSERALAYVQLGLPDGGWVLWSHTESFLCLQLRSCMQLHLSDAHHMAYLRFQGSLLTVLKSQE